MSVDPTTQAALDQMAANASDQGLIDSLNRSLELKNNQIADLTEQLNKAKSDLATAQQDLEDTRNAIANAVSQQNAPVEVTSSSTSSSSSSWTGTDTNTVANGGTVSGE